MNFLQATFLMANPNQPGSQWTSLIMMGAIILVFWFFMIRPQAKKAKEQKKFIDNLQKGDKIVTIAGIHGVINKVNDDGTINLEVNPGSYIKIERSAISLEWSNAINKTAAK
ncbi:MAG TPA: preprotein translocase subunit YajC [Chitinophagaceae bacterium]|nr:preprotein translocase subunit YajC [Chitinophagaceae bacterium]HNE92648.1 preprotein translocase subunit YajC [Chitinophagaceae bacterium]HNF30685.1 preprotein translocase subunit YajC [Chitinophagaceae bacterium]HNJ57772.1 preprotein translocase subunit YajC [Chitinophagaceae bacterium]HNM35093.1 preprotein translocase subunit YajC [Chitinophagaceae bacterium]